MVDLAIGQISRGYSLNVKYDSPVDVVYALIVSLCQTHIIIDLCQSIIAAQIFSMCSLSLSIGPSKPDWWFGTFFIVFPYIRNNHPN